MLVSGILMIATGLTLIFACIATDISAFNCIIGAIIILIGACSCLGYVSDVENRIKLLEKKISELADIISRSI